MKITRCYTALQKFEPEIRVINCVQLLTYLEQRSPQTESFINSWIKLALTQDIAITIADNQSARDLIRYREAFLKKKNARLGNSRALELWQGDAGTAQLDFRWFAAKRVMSDIINGLLQEDSLYVAA